MSSNKIKLSVIVCTYNRAEILCETLNSFKSIDFHRHSIEVIVVDNNSNDRTVEVVQRASTGDHLIRYVYESRQGLSNARNTGIKHATGNFIAFVDDDVFFDKDWGANAVLYVNSHREFSCFAGRIFPLYEGGLPVWLRPELSGVYSTLDLGTEVRPLNFPRTPVGANMIIRREVFDRIGGFDTELGRKGTNLLSNEEWEFFRKAAEAGFRTMYLPQVCVQHRIPASRTTPEWFIRRYFWQGISDAQSAWMQESWPRLRWIGGGLKTLCSVARLASGGNWSPLRMRWHYHSLDPAARAKIHMFLGWALHSLRLAVTQGMPRHPSGARRDWRTATETMLEHHHRTSPE